MDNIYLYLDMFYGYLGFGPKQLTVIILAIVFLVYYMKEKAEEISLNSKKTIQQSSQASISKISTKADQARQEKINEFKRKIINKKKNRNKPSQVLSSSGSAVPFFLKALGINLEGAELVVTEKMLKELKKMDSGSAFSNSFISKVVPRKMIEGLQQKALSGELQAGMKVKYEEGEVRVER